VLRRMRVNHLDMTQVQMARRLGCTKYKVCDFENSRRKLSVKAASAMATRLGFSPKLFALLVVRDRVAFQMRQAGIDLQMTFDVRL
jgi:plasmid maintenance system antidote protein VapI